MRDYAEPISDLRRHHCDAKEDDTQEVCEECAYDVIVADKSKFNGITDVCTCGLMHRAADTIEELLDELTTIRKQLPHWISVEERLPEHHKPVLVAYIGFNSNLLLSDMIAYRDGDGDWCWWDGKFPSGDICEVKVTYWMPLPAPPKGDAE